MIRLRCGSRSCNVCCLFTPVTTVPTFMLPNDLRRGLWLEALGLLTPSVSLLDGEICPRFEGVGVTINVVNENHLSTFSVCGRHFLPSMFTRIEQFGSVRFRYSLKRDAIPVLINREDWNFMFEMTTTEVQKDTLIIKEEPSDKPTSSIPPPAIGDEYSPDHIYAKLEPPIDTGHVATSSPKRVQQAISIVSGCGFSSLSPASSAASSARKDSTFTPGTDDEKSTSTSYAASDEEVEEDDEISGPPFSDGSGACIVESSNLIELFSVCRHPDCGKPVSLSNLRTSQSGARFIVHWMCNDGHCGEWNSFH